MTGEPPMRVKECKIECEGDDIFVIADGVKIAKRGHPGTAQAGTWVLLEPGWTVRASTYRNECAIELEYNHARIH
jgi:hypothetical protein